MFTLIAVAFAHAAASETPVRATLGDGQILFGDVRTKVLLLENHAGVLEIPLSDVGEVIPADGEALGVARGRVTVWLRNGSELRGTWVDPTMEMRVKVGGDDVAVELPMHELSRFQLQGGARWPSSTVYRLRTATGDDLLVDPARTTLVVESALGTFSPRLSECASVAPLGDPTGTWRVELETGTVLLGRLVDERLTVALPMGPDSVTIPLASFVSLRTESWSPVASMAYPPSDYGYDDVQAVEIAATGSRGRRPTHQQPLAAPPPASDWFDRAALEAAKPAN